MSIHLGDRFPSFTSGGPEDPESGPNNARIVSACPLGYVLTPYRLPTRSPLKVELPWKPSPLHIESQTDLLMARMKCVYLLWIYVVFRVDGCWVPSSSE